MNYIFGFIEVVIYIVCAIYAIKSSFKIYKEKKKLVLAGAIIENRQTFTTFLRIATFIVSLPLVILPFINYNITNPFLQYCILFSIFLFITVIGLLLQRKWMRVLVFTRDCVYTLFEEEKIISYNSINYVELDAPSSFNNSSNCTLLFYVNNKKYKAAIDEKEYEKIRPYFQESTKKNDSTLKNSKTSILVKVFMILGYIIVIFGGFLFISSLHFGTEIRDYTIKRSVEYNLVGINGIAIDSNGNIYCLSDYLSAVNVYTKNGDFEYSLAVPRYQNGENRIYFKNDEFYIEDKSHTIYYYKDGEFQGRARCDTDKGTICVYNQKDSLLYSAPVPNNSKYSYFPLYVDGDKLYVSDSNNSFLTYMKETLVSQEPYDYKNEPIIYATNKVIDIDGNTYCIKSIPSKLVKITPDGNTISIASVSLWDWIRQTPFAAWSIAAIGIAFARFVPFVSKQRRRSKFFKK